ncbi:MAG: D-alanyl-D-alanine carboxypeptidase [Leucobacter sp.]|nr:D-alanyl-D-alanine carboxypeptidase [Leucobacter sp.]
MTSASPDLRLAQRRQRRRFSQRRRRRLTATLTVTAVLIGGGYSAAVGLAPLPELSPQLSVDATQTITASTKKAEAAVASQSLPTAIGWGDGNAVWSNDDEAHPIASITKLVTVLVCLEQQPLEPGEDGPDFVYGAAEAQREAELRAQDAIMHPVPVGTVLTTRQVLELALIPSSNDYAIAYAYRVFGGNDAFVDAASAWAAEHGLESLSIVEPSGLSAENRASAADLVRLGRLALQNPTVLEIVKMTSADVPPIGRIETTNPLLGEVKGVMGLKTGSLDVAGFNLLLAQKKKFKGRSFVQLSATLARPSREARAASGREMLALMDGLPGRKRFVAEGEEVGSVTTWQGERVPLLTAAGARGVLLPGESATRSISLGAVDSGAAGRVVGSIAIEAPTEVDPVTIVTGAAITEPDFWWRFTHPAEVL